MAECLRCHWGIYARRTTPSLPAPSPLKGEGKRRIALDHDTIIAIDVSRPVKKYPPRFSALFRYSGSFVSSCKSMRFTQHDGIGIGNGRVAA